MPELSICMPSNRNFADSRESIESALAYCEARDALLIVSDNSGDSEKHAHWKAGHPRLTYFHSPGIPSSDNMLQALDGASTPFILNMGDDDAVFCDVTQPAVDLEKLPFDYVGVLPLSETFSKTLDMVQRKTFALKQEEPIDRISAYISAARGNNSLYYSIFRRDIYSALTHFFVNFHPTRGGYTDWAIALAMVSYGKMEHDNGTIFRYNLGNWDTDEKIAKSTTEIYRNAGLPDGAQNYERLLIFLDLFVFTARIGTPLSHDARQKLGRDIVNRMFTGFITEMSNSPEKFDGTVRYLATMALDEQDAFTRFQIGLMMADRIQPGLKDRYVTFLKQAAGAA
ncbi:MAG: hypothetical protein ACOH2J_07595 [Allorhizobium sp.]